MTQKRVLLSVRRFRQKSNECAICASTSLANYYDKGIDYEDVRQLLNARTRQNGLYTAEQAKLLNTLGFECVTVVTNDLDLVDYSWSNLSKRRLVGKLKRMLTHIRRSVSHVAPHSLYSGWQKSREQSVGHMIEWLESPVCDNQLVIDHDFPKYIKRSLDRGHPVGVSVNATSMFKLKKGGARDADIKGEVEEHAVVIRGYDDKGVFIVDSDNSDDSRYGRGYYKISWEQLLTNMPSGDLILVA